ncbi:MAG: serine hydrolase [Ignavibacteria bacterium]|jgi:beta-lactamase class A|nr:serine hydrolase [Ignavibacteria bacterium]MCU7502425.1 serine hydrolase [Ignavibacteria bacterium]MCU7515010.1 serine hydrolase [Ignavibacteria bacterium]
MESIRRACFLCLLLLLTNVSQKAQVKTLKLDELKDKISKEFSGVKGNFALAFKDMQDPGNTILINADETFHAASTMKTPVMVEVFRQAAMGKFSLDDSIQVKNEFKSIVDGSSFSMAIDRDSGEGLYKFINRKRTIRQLVFEMITVSSNLATNILIELVKAENAQNTMLSLGAKNIRVLRGVEDIKAFDKGLNNTTTAKDLMIIFEQIAKGSVVSKEACREMTDILLKQKFRDVIPQKLPRSVKVAHKTGSVDGIKHDSGFVILPDGRQYVLVILSKNLEDMERGTEVLSGVSKIVYDYYVNQK